MEKARTKPAQGSILISEPSLRDFYFRQAVVLLAEHNEEGTFGVIINKPIEARLKDVIKGFPPYNLPVFLGGPVKTDSIFYIHTHADVDECVPIMQGLYWGGDLAVIKSKLKHKEILPNEIRFFVGYSGWSPRQLDREIQDNTWLSVNADETLLFDANHGTKWRRALAKLNVDPLLLSPVAGHA